MKRKKGQFRESNSFAVINGRKVLATQREIEYGYGPAAVRLRHKSSDANYIGSDQHLRDLKTFKWGKRKDTDAANSIICLSVTLRVHVTGPFFVRESVN